MRPIASHKQLAKHAICPSRSSASRDRTVNKTPSDVDDIFGNALQPEAEKPVFAAPARETRKEVRVKVKWAARVQLPNGAVVEMRVCDISENGIGLAGEVGIPPHSVLTCAVAVPGLNDPNKITAIVGTIKTTHATVREAPGCAMMRAHQDLIRKLIRRLRGSLLPSGAEAFLSSGDPMSAFKQDTKAELERCGRCLSLSRVGVQSVAVDPYVGADGRNGRLAYGANRAVAHAHVHVIDGCRPFVGLDGIAQKPPADSSDDAAERVIPTSTDLAPNQCASETSSDRADAIVLALNLHRRIGVDHSAGRAHRNGCDLLRSIAPLDVAWVISARGFAAVALSSCMVRWMFVIRDDAGRIQALSAGLRHARGIDGG